MSKDITQLIERLELFEERLGIRLEGLYAEISDDCQWVTVNGEVHALEGMKLKQDIRIVGAVYDNSGHVLSTNDHGVLAAEFYGFKVFALPIELPPRANITKIRIYPEVW
jgi:hypothetical protein